MMDSNQSVGGYRFYFQAKPKTHGPRRLLSMEERLAEGLQTLAASWIVKSMYG